MKTQFLTSLQNPLVKHWVKLRQDRDYRYAEQALVIEGIKPVREVVGLVKRLICMEGAPQFLDASISERWIVSEAIMKKISGMMNPEGVLAEVQMPAFTSLKQAKFIIALDGISDPGNLGTLLRTALALGWEGAYILPNSCDPFNEKAIRAARGAHFHLPLAMGSAKELHALAEANALELLVADLEGISPESLSKQNGRVLVLGNEARGPSEDVRNFCRKVTIPMPGEMESLNVAIAGGILMYVIRNRI